MSRDDKDLEFPGTGPRPSPLGNGSKTVACHTEPGAAQGA